MYLCPYCGRTLREAEGGYSPACCGEVHCIDLGDDSTEADADKKWQELQDEMCAYVRDPANFFLPKEK